MKDTWGPPAGAGWPKFCERCGKRRFVEVWDEEVGAYILDDQHACEQREAA